MKHVAIVLRHQAYVCMYVCNQVYCPYRARPAMTDATPGAQFYFTWAALRATFAQ